MICYKESSTQENNRSDKGIPQPVGKRGKPEEPDLSVGQMRQASMRITGI